MQRADIEEARRIVRVAFGAFVGAPDPERWNADRDHVYPRWRTDPEGFYYPSSKASWRDPILRRAGFDRWGVREAACLLSP